MKAYTTTSRRVMAGAALFALAACGGGDGSADAAPAPGSDPSADAPAASRIINVETRVVETEDFREEVRLTGVVQANRDVVVSAEESGAVVELLRDEGRQVWVGSPLLRIDDRILRAEVARAEAQADLAVQTWERRRRLWEEDAVGSELSYLEARANARQAEANLAALRERLDRTLVTSPIDGFIEERRVELGALVTPGTPVFRIVDVTPLQVRAGVPERYALDVVPGATGVVSFDVFPGEAFEAEVTFVGTTVDRQSRTFPIELTLSDQRGVIKPEMIANVAVERGLIEDAIVVPQNAVVRREEGYVAFVVDGEVARAVPVVLGPNQENRVVILEGLAPGDELVVVGQQMVSDGDRIRIVEEAAR